MLSKVSSSLNNMAKPKISSLETRAPVLTCLKEYLNIPTNWECNELIKTGKQITLYLVQKFIQIFCSLLNFSTSWALNFLCHFFDCVLKKLGVLYPSNEPSFQRLLQIKISSEAESSHNWNSAVARIMENAHLQFPILWLNLDAGSSWQCLMHDQEAAMQVVLFLSQRQDWYCYTSNHPAALGNPWMCFCSSCQHFIQQNFNIIGVKKFDWSFCSPIKALGNNWWQFIKHCRRGPSLQDLRETLWRER